MIANYISNTPEGKDFFEGKSQHLVATAIYDTINSCSKLPHIIGLEGDWGSGKSNVIKQLSTIDNFNKNYYLFTYDAWGHQEDLQRRSILEVLTTELIKNELLVGKGKVRLRNGEVKEDKWSSLLSYLLSNKTITTLKPTVRITSFTLWMLFVMVVYSGTSYVCVKEILGKTFAYYPYVFAIPYILGAIIIVFYALMDCSFRSLRQYVSKTDAEKVTEEYVSSEEPSIQEFRNWMQAISDYIGSNHKQKLILVFDNMDRLASEKVKQLWSSIYSFFAGEAFENIWIIIPYDEKHLVSAFSEGGDQKTGDNFIKKTFSMVYRVSPPVISDYELLFHSYFVEAFGKHEDENRINQVFRVLNPNPNPRDVIYFLNQMVSLVRMWNDKIPLADIALYVCRKVSHHRNDRVLDEYLLSNDIFQNVGALFVHHEKTKVNMAKIAYGLSDDGLAMQIPMRSYLRAYFEGDGNQNINELVENPHFVTVLTNVINKVPPTLINRYIIGLGKLDSSKLSDEDKKNIRHKWDYLVNKWKENGIDKQTLTDEPKLLLLHCSDNYKYGLVSNIVKKLQTHPEFKGKDYYIAMDALRQFITANSIQYDFSTDDWVSTSAEIFWGYLYEAKDKYLDFHVYTSSKELMAYLSDSNLKTCKLPELVGYLTNDLRYDFIPLLDFCSHLINEGEVEKDNVCTLLYYVSFVYNQIKNQIVLRRNLPKAEVLSNLYTEVYEQDEYVNKTGYWDFVFLSMILAAKTPQIENINLDKLAHVSVKYDCFNDIFVNLSNVYESRKRLAQRIIELKLKGCLNIVTKLNALSSIQAATTLPWESVLNYFSLYVDDLSEEDKDSIKEDFTNYVPGSLFTNLTEADCKLVQWIVSVGRECLESGEHEIFSTNGTIIDGYWKDFVVYFLGTNVWPHTDGYVLDGLKNIFNLYCENHDISLIKNDFVSNLIEHIKQEDYLPLINLARNSFTVGSRHASVDEFNCFGYYIPELGTEIPNVETFVQNFIEYAFLNNSESRTLIYNCSKFYMPLVNQSYRIANGIIKYINEHKNGDEICAKLYEMLSDEVKESLKPKDEGNGK